MALARSRLTTQGQVSVPAEVRRKLGVGPRPLPEWTAEGNAIVVRQAGKYSSEDIQRALFGDVPADPRPLHDLKEGIRAHIRARHARG